MAKETILLQNVPFYRKVPNTAYVVDFFIKTVTDADAFFLTHYHSDHYGGLTKKFDSIIYCSETTGNIIEKFIGLDSTKIKKVPMQEILNLNENQILFYEANHCPGAVGIIFAIKSKLYLHTGDFRYNFEIHQNLNDLINIFNIREKNKFDMVFCDNTYENYHNFKSQMTVIQELISDIIKSEKATNKLAPIPTKYIFTSYFIGKEKLYLTVGYYFQWKICVQDRKMRVFDCFDQYSKNILEKFVIDACNSMKIEKISSSTFSFQKQKNQVTKEKLSPFELLCTDKKDSKIDVLPMNYITNKKLNEMYGNQKYKKLIVISGTGWTKKEQSMIFTKSNGTKIKSGIQIIQYPYSEHSSSSELEEFKNFVKANEIIPTVKFSSYRDVD
ncbi:tRNase Z [Pseudoloma neurophilia]|uniref:TRNase Z n=1 Tax=Pseudoloma neurophilia TaxID=146866 RepID=A0A0R0LZ77_9MICR|nr:tRNase Z [Pseudoloma neurophilia]